MWSRSVKIISAFTIATLGAAMLFLTLLICSEISAGTPFLSVEIQVTAFTLLILMGTMGWVFLYFPRKILARNGNLIVMRFKEDKIIEAGNIVYIRKTSGKELSGAGICGSGGVFGYFGIIMGGKNGKVSIYAQNLKHLLFIEMRDGKKYYISYDPSDGEINRFFESVTG